MESTSSTSSSTSTAPAPPSEIQTSSEVQIVQAPRRSHVELIIESFIAGTLSEAAKEGKIEASKNIENSWVAALKKIQSNSKIHSCVHQKRDGSKCGKYAKNFIGNEWVCAGPHTQDAKRRQKESITLHQMRQDNARLVKLMEIRSKHQSQKSSPTSGSPTFSPTYLDADLAALNIAEGMEGVSGHGA